MALQKTNAMRLLDKEKIDYQVYTYEHQGAAVDGLHVASILKQNPSTVFKTLVTIANTKEYLVYVIPVEHELDLKKCAKAANVKATEMIAVKDIQKITGYIRGGCSPIGMKKSFRTFINDSCNDLDTMMFSGGKIGIQLAMCPKDLITLINAIPYNLIKE